MSGIKRCLRSEWVTRICDKDHEVKHDNIWTSLRIWQPVWTDTMYIRYNGIKSITVVIQIEEAPLYVDLFWAPHIERIAMLYDEEAV